MPWIVMISIKCELNKNLIYIMKKREYHTEAYEKDGEGLNAKYSN